jgi:hypothetical protein
LARGGILANSGYYVQDEHAISPDGDQVYFTAGDSGQIYLRKGLSGPDPETVDVSASQATNPSPGDPKPAAFMGATPDGAHAFFTSPGELTDDANTGPDVAPPAIGLANIADGSGVETDHVSLPTTPPNSVETDGSYLYWIEPGGDSIARSDLNGITVEHDFITGLDDGQDLAVDSGQIYWTNAAHDASFPPVAGGTIGRADLPANPGDPPTNIDQDCITGLERPRGIDGNESGFIYWASGGHNSNGGVSRADISGSCADANVSKVLNFQEGILGPNDDVAVSGSYIYGSISQFAGLDKTFISRWNLDGSRAAGQIEFDSPRGTESALTLDGSHVYWSNTDTGAIGRADLDLGNADDSFITGITAPVGLAVGQGADSAHLYWATGITDASRGRDLYRYDASSGDLADVAPLTDPAQPKGAEAVGFIGASDDGSYVYFVANGDLDGDGPATQGNCQALGVGGGSGTQASGSCSLYLTHDGAVSLVAPLDLAEGSGSDSSNWTPAQQTIGFAEGPTSRVSADGRAVVFRSRNMLTSYDNSGGCGGPCPQYYRYSVDDGLACITCNPTGASGGGARTTSIQQPGATKPGNRNANLTRNLSPDGNRFLFDTPDKLVAQDKNGLRDVYEWEADGTGTCTRAASAFSAQNEGCLYLLSAGTGNSPSFFGDASADGDHVFIFTRDQLVPQDTDSLQDVYDVGVGAGLASQHQAPPAGCSGDACQGAGSPSPSDPGSGTSAFSGPGNQGKNGGGTTQRRKACNRNKKAKRKQGAAKKAAKRRARHCNRGAKR